MVSFLDCGGNINGLLRLAYLVIWLSAFKLGNTLAIQPSYQNDRIYERVLSNIGYLQESVSAIRAFHSGAGDRHFILREKIAGGYYRRIGAGEFFGSQGLVP